MKMDFVDLLLDSGAYSAMTQGVKINVNDYIQFIKANLQYIKQYITLDVIGDGEQTFRNYWAIKSHGLSPKPVYHIGTDEKYLKAYLKDTDDITIGAISEMTTKKRIVTMDPIWRKYLTDSKGNPIVKVHGLGMTSLNILLRYPWHSVDSKSWVDYAQYGSVLVPRMKKGRYVYDHNPHVITVSTKSPNQREMGRRFSTLHGIEKMQIEEYFEEKGFQFGESEMEKVNDKKVEKIIEIGLCNDFQLRAELNMLFYLDLEKSLRESPRRSLKR